MEYRYRLAGGYDLPFGLTLSLLYQSFCGRRTADVPRASRAWPSRLPGLRSNGSRHAYRVTDKGRKVALLFVLFQQRVCGSPANSLFNQPPDPQSTLATPLETAYRKAEESIQHVINLLDA